MPFRIPVLLALVSVFCASPDPPEDFLRRPIQDSVSRQTESGPVTPEPWLSKYDLKEKNPKSFKLSKKVGEISGLAMTDDGRLLCHDDESAIVYEVDWHDGKIVKRFSIGSGFLEEDFEGIAVKRDTIFLVTSGGDILEFQEGPDRGHVPFKLYKTKLNSRNDVEGLEYDDSTNSLLLACKGYPGKDLKGYKAVYAFLLESRTLQEDPRYLIPLKVLEKKARKGNFNPSGIALHPGADTFFIISSDGLLAIEMDRSGTILAQQKISGKANSQPEGIVFTDDLELLLANDGQGGRGTMTFYPPGTGESGEQAKPSSSSRK